MPIRGPDRVPIDIRFHGESYQLTFAETNVQPQVDQPFDRYGFPSCSDECSELKAELGTSRRRK